MKYSDFAPFVKNLQERILRRLFVFLPASLTSADRSWRWLRFYPPLRPTTEAIRALHQSDWPDYQRWLQKHSLQSQEQWRTLRERAMPWRHPAKISIVTPVFNTDPEELYQCVLSVRSQAYPYWQLILVDDASTRPETLALLAAGTVRDPRIRIHRCRHGRGIAGATNIGLQQALGDYVLFLDHDDRLAPEALFYLAQEIMRQPEADIIYSDRDMISTVGKLFMHLFKPDWSPETLLSGNYVFHPMCYRRCLLQQLGGLSERHEGSQDYDLILRAAELNPKVRHIPKVLYHWRQSRQSVALNADSKHYAFAAGVSALNDALARRGVEGTATEIPDLWRGNYRLKLARPAADPIAQIEIDQTQPELYRATVAAAADRHPDKAYLVVIGQDMMPLTEDALSGLAAWLQFERVGIVSGKIIDAHHRIVYAGAVYKQDGSLLSTYAGYPESEPGYMAVTQIARNISAPAPYCSVIKLSMWRQLGGFRPGFEGPRALLDLALRGLAADWRCVIDPQFKFRSEHPAFPLDDAEAERDRFQRTWRDWLQRGDPYYNVNLTQDRPDMHIGHPT